MECELSPTERLFRAFVALNFFSALVNSNITCVHIPHNGAYLPSSCPSVLTYSPRQIPRSSLAAGISFCLITVRLHDVPPESREETWRKSGKVSTPIPKVKVQRDAHGSNPKNPFVGGLESREQGSVDYSGLQKVDQASLSLPTPA